ncbi:MAG: NAD(P)-dependent oxidoreductase [Synergistaceae bacterium]|jgi:dTDP-glucose 4,6-dehydratase|nr:NAD(P)-dependent oxidoreductase [Synergistaceae bacterium]
MTDILNPSAQLINDGIDRVARYIPNEPGIHDVRFFITGATGFVGVWLLKTLLRLSEARNWRISITILSRRPEVFARKHPEFFKQVNVIKGDVLDFEFPAGEFKYIIHAAADTSAQVNKDAPVYLFDSIVSGTKRVMEFAARCGCRKLLYVSSGAVYGPQPTHIPRVDESYMGGPDPTQPTGNDLYGNAKRTAELITTLYAKQYGFEAKIARLFSFVGPYLPIDSHFAVGNFISNYIKGQPIIIKGDGAPFRSYMYAADMILWILKILFDAPASRPYNVGSDFAVTIAELAGIIAKLVQPEPPVTIMQQQRSEKSDIYVPSLQRAREELGLDLYFDLEEAIKTTIQWHIDKDAAHTEESPEWRESLSARK